MLSDGTKTKDTGYISDGTCAGSFSSSTNVAVGGTARGCIAMEVPEKGTLDRFQFTLNSGYAKDTGVWRLR